MNAHGVCYVYACVILYNHLTWELIVRNDEHEKEDWLEHVFLENKERVYSVMLRMSKTVICLTDYREMIC